MAFVGRLPGPAIGLVLKAEWGEVTTGLVRQLFQPLSIKIFHTPVPQRKFEYFG